jgi:hypothetical protein
VFIDVIHRVVLVIGSGAGTAWSWHCSERRSADVQIDLWNKHPTNNDVWVFSPEIKELSCKLLIIICRLYIYIMSATLLVHMDVLCEPFLQWCNWRDSSCATSMFFSLEGCAVLIFLALRLEFTGLLFSDEIFGIFSHSSNIRVWSDQLSIVIYTRPTLDPVSHSQRATFKGIWYPSLTKFLFILYPEWDCNLIPTRSYSMLELILLN